MERGKLVISVPQAQMFFLALTRILAMIIHIPILGGRLVPNLIKIGLGGIMAFALLDWQPIPAETPSMTTFAFGLAIGREILIGTIAGFAATLTFTTFQIAGDLMGLGSGFASAYIFNPTFESSGSPLENLFVLMATLLFLVINAHHGVLISVARTFDILPLATPLPELSAQNLIALFSQLIATGVYIAIPILGCILLADITLGVLARVSPQIHVFFLGLPIKVGLGIFALALTLTMIFPKTTQLFYDLPIRILDLFEK